VFYSLLQACSESNFGDSEEVEYRLVAVIVDEPACDMFGGGDESGVGSRVEGLGDGGESIQ